MAYVNMSQPGATCPQGLTQRTISGLALCGANTTLVGCRSTVFSTLGLSYSQVCGQVRGYQFYAPADAFRSVSIDSAYVDGVSITYGTAPRKHIWTYANGNNLDTGNHNCPCNNGSSAIPPLYVGSDYYCETGNNNNVEGSHMLYSNDTLWDGQQCPGVEAPCCTHPNMPWFTKTLSETTIEDIELRLCRSWNDEDTPLELIELFVR